MDRKFLPRHIARIAQVSPLTIRRWCQEGHLKAARVGPGQRYVIAEADLTEFLKHFNYAFTQDTLDGALAQ